MCGGLFPSQASARQDWGRGEGRCYRTTRRGCGLALERSRDGGCQEDVCLHAMHVADRSSRNHTGTAHPFPSLPSAPVLTVTTPPLISSVPLATRPVFFTILGIPAKTACVIQVSPCLFNTVAEHGRDILKSDIQPT